MFRFLRTSWFCYCPAGILCRIDSVLVTQRPGQCKWLQIVVSPISPELWKSKPLESTVIASPFWQPTLPKRQMHYRCTLCLLLHLPAHSPCRNLLQSHQISSNFIILILSEQMSEFESLSCIEPPSDPLCRQNSFASNFHAIAPVLVRAYHGLAK